MKPKIIAVVGPTSSGKSALAVRLARQFNGEIISADSRQVYKGLNIGSGKITKRERRNVPHHLLDVVSPRRTFTVARYKKLAEKAIADITRRGKLPILAGGTGFYLDAALDGITIPSVPPDRALRARLEKSSTEELFKKLQGLDADRAKNIDRHNRRRLIRAIEIAQTQMLNTRCLTKCSTPSVAQDYWVLKIGMLIDREKLRQNIQTRLRQRLKHGLIAEVKRLRAGGLSWQRLDNFGLDCRYAARYLQNKISREQMNSRLETAIWHYGKRQMTWWRRDPIIHWVRNYRKAEQFIRDFLKK